MRNWEIKGKTLLRCCSVILLIWIYHSQLFYIKKIFRGNSSFYIYCIRFAYVTFTTLLIRFIQRYFICFFYSLFNSQFHYLIIYKIVLFYHNLFILIRRLSTTYRLFYIKIVYLCLIHTIFFPTFWASISGEFFPYKQFLTKFRC